MLKKVVSILCFGLLPVAAGGQTWSPKGPPFVVNSSVEPIQSEAVISSSSLNDSRFVAVWRSQDQGAAAGSIRARIFAKDGKPLGEEFPVSTALDSDHRHPAVDWDDHGNFVIAWSGFNPGAAGWDVYVRGFQGDGTATGEPFRVNSTTDSDQFYPAVSMASFFYGVVAWETRHQDGSGLGIVRRSLHWSYADRELYVFGEEFQVNTATDGDQVEPSLCNCTFGFAAAWESYDPGSSGWRVFTAAFPADGPPAGVEIEASTTATPAQPFPVIACNRDEGFTVAWQALGPDGTSTEIHARRFDAAAQPLGAELRVSSGVQRRQFDPQIWSWGELTLIVWQAEEEAGGTSGIHGQFLGRDSQHHGPSFLVQPMPATQRAMPAVAMNERLAFFTWTGQGAGDPAGVHGRGFELSREFEVLVSDAGITNETRASVATQPAGDSLVVWQSEGSSDEPAMLHGRRFDGAGQPYGDRFPIHAETTAQRDPPAVFPEPSSSRGFRLAWTTRLQGRSDLEIQMGFYDSALGLELGPILNHETAGDQSAPTLTENCSGGVALWETDHGTGNIDIKARTIGSNSSPEFPVNTTTQQGHQGKPVACADAARNLVAIWQSQESASSPWRILGQRLLAGKPLGSEFVVNGSATVHQRSPAVACDIYGGFLVAWESEEADGTASDILAQRFDNWDQPASEVFRVNTHAEGDQTSPRIAQSERGQLLVIWENDPQDGTDKSIYGRAYEPDGTPAAEEEKLNLSAGDAIAPSVSLAPDGDAMVVWTSTSPAGPSEIRARLLGVASRGYKDRPLDGPEFKVSAGWEDGVSVAAMDPSGDVAVVWDTGSRLLGRYYDSAGAPKGEEFLVTDELHAAAIPDAALGPRGKKLIVVWTGQQGSDTDILCRLFDSSGRPVSKLITVNETKAGLQALPTIAIDEAGNFVVAWQSRGQDGAGWGIFGQRFDRTGKRLGSELSINSSASGDQVLPEVAVEPSGAFNVYWTTPLSSSNEWAVFVRRFDSSGVPARRESKLSVHESTPVVLDGGTGDIVTVHRTSYQTRPPLPEQFNYWKGLVVQFFSRDGIPRGPALRINSMPTQGKPALAQDAAGNTLVAWGVTTGCTVGVFGQLYTAGGLPWGDVFQINTVAPNDYNALPAVVGGPPTRFFAFWAGTPPFENSALFGRSLMLSPALVPAGTPAILVVLLLTLPICLKIRGFAGRRGAQLGFRTGSTQSSSNPVRTFSFSAWMPGDAIETRRRDSSSSRLIEERSPIQ